MCKFFVKLLLSFLKTEFLLAFNSIKAFSKITKCKF